MYVYCVYPAISKSLLSENRWNKLRF